MYRLISFFSVFIFFKIPSTKMENIWSLLFFHRLLSFIERWCSLVTVGGNRFAQRVLVLFLFFCIGLKPLSCFQIYFNTVPSKLFVTTHKSSLRATKQAHNAVGITCSLCGICRFGGYLGQEISIVSTFDIRVIARTVSALFVRWVHIWLLWATF